MTTKPEANLKIHPLEIFVDGKLGLGKFTPEQFDSARRLLWAVPELLSVLEDVVYESSCADDDDVFQRLSTISKMAKAAIAKAEGGCQP